MTQRTFWQKAKMVIKWLPVVGVVGLSAFPLQIWVRQCLVMVVMLWSIIAIWFP